MKRCGTCKLRKSYIDFYNNRSTPDGYSWQCKRCTNKYAKSARIGMYGLTKAQFEHLLEGQDNRCAICQIIFNDEFFPVIDHDHDCCPRKDREGRLVKRCGNCVRGLLCVSCNAGLGMFKDDIQKLYSAILYLRRDYRLNFEVETLSLESIEFLVDIIG